MATVATRTDTLDAPAPTGDLSEKIDALDAELEALDEQIDDLTEKRAEAKAAKDDAEERFFDGEGTASAVSEHRETERMYAEKLRPLKEERRRLQSERDRLQCEHEQAEALDRLVELANEAEAARGDHDAAFSEAVDAVDTLLDAADAALESWRERAWAFRKAIAQAERSAIDEDRRTYDAATSLLRQLEERGANLEAVFTVRTGLNWPSPVKRATPTYWLPVSPKESRTAELVEELLAERVRASQGRELKGGV